ncbi:Csu type fimbrial protein [Acinetobacter stercoris]|uniref:Spore Coat Protein U domain protein n=1 Tax=Acinetobacter stercoris TaxID=2126983 RepID=A0A2U3MV63_9GAMM|nr:spore coat U domain-containing protein [Acinetobacter stercoris]SPL69306.1 Spore Coat Protein U domain protein [Acinetobacter stercoris]
MKKFIFCLSLVSSSIMTTETVLAANATGTLTVKATITASCAVNTNATGTTTNAVLDFGTQNSFAANVDANTSSTDGTKIGVLCNNGTSWTLTADGGKNAAASQRNMIGGTAGTELIPYNLYSDSKYATAINVGGTVQAGSGTGALQSYDIYGRIPAGTQLPSVGTYLDTVQLTVTY